MKVLIVGFSESIHTARWIKQVSGSDVELHLFPSVDQGVAHPELSGVTIHHSFFGKHKKWPHPSNVKSRGINIGHDFPAHVLRYTVSKLNPHYRERELSKIIKHLKPDLIHSLEIQHGGYLVDEVRKNWKGKFPSWMVTNWGSDIYLFGQLPEHKEKIRSVLSHCDYYSCECERDVDLAKKFGFTGKILSVMPNAGGLDLKFVKQVRGSGKSSGRKVIALKGYQNWSGRALVGLRALERCADILKGYKIVIYSALPESSGVNLSAELFREKSGVDLRILPPETSHLEILRLHASARISIGLSISDGISTSFLEAMAMGSFPIQSNTACADEWIECGKTGFLVPPEDPEEIEKKIRIALTDDKLVDTAAKINWETTKQRLDGTKLAAQAKEMYQEIVNEIKI